MKKIISLVLLLIIVSSFSVFAQDECEKTCCENGIVDVRFNADIVSRYLWRGMEFGVTNNSPASPQFQPSININFALNSENTISIGAWGSYGFSGDYNECDLNIKYAYSPASLGTIALTINDFYFPFMGRPFSNYEKEGAGAHTVELNLSYTGTEKFPINLIVANNILGDAPDHKSFYAEIGYTVIVKNVSLFFFTGGAQGVSPWNMVSKDGFIITNVGVTASKTIKITDDYSVPVGVTWVTNPHLDHTLFAVKIGIL